MASIAERSGQKSSTDPLVTFVYLLLRDHLTAGDMEELLKALPESQVLAKFSNGWLASYAEDVVARLRQAPTATPKLTDFQPNGLMCSVCLCPQYDTPSGPCCKNSHGGAPGREPIEGP